MKKKTVLKGALALACISTLATAQEQKFNVYGFADMNLTKYWMQANSPFLSFDTDENLNVSLGHVNPYFDFRPNNKTRAMVELSFQGAPVGDRVRNGSYFTYGWRDTTANTAFGPAAISDTAFVMATAGSPYSSNTKIKALDGLVYDWGSFSLERAWFELGVNQYANVRVGKFITPAGVWNVDHGSPIILPVKQPYQTGLVAIFPKSQYGIMNQGTAFLGNADLNYSAYLSTGRISNPDGSRNSQGLSSMKDLSGGANLSLSIPVLSGLKLGASGFSGMLKQSYAQRVIANLDLTDQMVEFTEEAVAMAAVGELAPSDIEEYVAGNIEKYVTTYALNPDNHSYEVIKESQAREVVFGADATLDIENVSIQTEFNHQRIKNHLMSDSLTSTTGFYGLLSYRIGLSKVANLTPYVMFERVVQDGADNNAGSFLSGYNTGTPESVVEGFQTYLAGLNLRLHANYVIKLEYMYGDVLTQGIYKDNQDVFDASGLNVQFSMAF